MNSDSRLILSDPFHERIKVGEGQTFAFTFYNNPMECNIDLHRFKVLGYSSRSFPITVRWACEVIWDIFKSNSCQTMRTAQVKLRSGLINDKGILIKCAAPR